MDLALATGCSGNTVAGRLHLRGHVNVRTRRPLHLCGLNPDVHVR